MVTLLTRAIVILGLLLSFLGTSWSFSYTPRWDSARHDPFGKAMRELKQFGIPHGSGQRLVKAPGMGQDFVNTTVPYNNPQILMEDTILSKPWETPAYLDEQIKDLMSDD